MLAMDQIDIIIFMCMKVIDTTLSQQITNGSNRILHIST